MLGSQPRKCQAPSTFRVLRSEGLSSFAWTNGSTFSCLHPVPPRAAGQGTHEVHVASDIKSPAPAGWGTSFSWLH